MRSLEPDRAGPLTNREAKLLIRAAHDEQWTPTLRNRLREAIDARRGRWSRYDNCGALAELLEELST